MSMAKHVQRLIRRKRLVHDLTHAAKRDKISKQMSFLNCADQSRVSPTKLPSRTARSPHSFNFLSDFGLSFRQSLRTFTILNVRRGLSFEREAI